MPAYFDNKQRQAIKDSAKIAKLDVLRVINEPIAAGLAYGIDKFEYAADRYTLIIDFGGASFDVTCLCMNLGKIAIVSTSDDAYLGGRNFDQEIVEYCCFLFE